MFSCGDDAEAHDKMAMNENNIKMLKELRSGAAVMEHYIKQMSEAATATLPLSGICSTAHVAVFDGMFGQRPLDMMKRCLASAHKLQSELCKHWTSDITGLTNAVNSLCPKLASQGRRLAHRCSSRPPERVDEQHELFEDYTSCGASAGWDQAGEGS